MKIRLHSRFAGLATANPYNARMEILLNGKATVVPDGMTISALLSQVGLGERRVAVEVNREVVPRSRHPQHVLQGGDRVEIVHAIGGG